MSLTYTQSQTETFTITNAKYLASKVYADLLRLHRYYCGTHYGPTLDEIKQYHDELVLLQMHGYLEEIEYGFVYNDSWVKALKYTARQGSALTANDDPGGIRFSSGVPLTAKFSSMLWYNAKWIAAPQHEKDNFKNISPVNRGTGDGYAGIWKQQREYSSGGHGLARSGI